MPTVSKISSDTSLSWCRCGLSSGRVASFLGTVRPPDLGMRSGDLTVSAISAPPNANVAKRPLFLICFSVPIRLYTRSEQKANLLKFRSWHAARNLRLSLTGSNWQSSPGRAKPSPWCARELARANEDCQLDQEPPPKNEAAREPETLKAGFALERIIEVPGSNI